MGKFRIKACPWWASSDRMIFKYSTNGIWWRTIKRCSYDVLLEDYIMEDIVEPTGESTADWYINFKFKDLDSVKKYEAEQLRIYDELCEKVSNHKKIRNEGIKNVYRKFS